MPNPSYSRLVEEIFATSSFHRVTRSSLNKRILTEFHSKVGPLWKVYTQKALQHFVSTGSIILRGRYYYVWVSKVPPRRYFFRTRKNSTEITVPLTPPVTGIENSPMSRNGDSKELMEREQIIGLNEYHSLSAGLISARISLGQELKVNENLSHEHNNLLFQKCVLNSDFGRIQMQRRQLVKILMKLQIENHFLEDHLRTTNERNFLDDIPDEAKDLEEYKKEKLGDFERFKANLLEEKKQRKASLMEEHLRGQELMRITCWQKRNYIGELKLKLSEYEGKIQEFRRLNAQITRYLNE